MITSISDGGIDGGDVSSENSGAVGSSNDSCGGGGKSDDNDGGADENDGVGGTK